jgi:hypothetical protein
MSERKFMAECYTASGKLLGVVPVFLDAATETRPASFRFEANFNGEVARVIVSHDGMEAFCWDWRGQVTTGTTVITEINNMEEFLT